MHAPRSTKVHQTVGLLLAFVWPLCLSSAPLWRHYAKTHCCHIFDAKKASHKSNVISLPEWKFLQKHLMAQGHSSCPFAYYLSVKLWGPKTKTQILSSPCFFRLHKQRSFSKALARTVPSMHALRANFQCESGWNWGDSSLAEISTRGEEHFWIKAYPLPITLRLLACGTCDR